MVPYFRKLPSRLGQACGVERVVWLAFLVMAILIEGRVEPEVTFHAMLELAFHDSTGYFLFILQSYCQDITVVALLGSLQPEILSGRGRTSAHQGVW